MAWTLKVDLDGDLRRLPNFNPYGINDTLVSYETIAHSVSQLYGLPAAMAQTLVLKYRDDEGDMCTLVPSTVQDAVRVSEAVRLMKLFAKRGDQKTSPAAPSAGACGRTGWQGA
mmetsp:Transcript_7465/g.10266  ORF Transcript_7465/g.10266 Transcript_7465/m.10266 type:complete len:114 (+) Transcript_7465:67-408(+)